MAGDDRLTRLLAQTQTTYTGIDFVQVSNPSDQKSLALYFYVDPKGLDDPFEPDDIDPSQVSIVSTSGGERLAEATVTDVTFVPGGGTDRSYLKVQVAEPGDFSLYRLTITGEDRIDRFFSSVVFSFKQGCDSKLDCKPPPHQCPEEELVDFPVDYLARDFHSLRSALLDFAAQRYPRWQEKIEADMGVMLLELMAALGDELAYVQDRYAREAYISTATQRRSIRRHTRLVDYHLHDGLSATTYLSLKVTEGGGEKEVEAGDLVSTPTVEGVGSIPFEIGEGLEDQHSGESGAARTFTLNESWNELTVYLPDPSQPCLPVGSTELWLKDDFSAAEETWIGREMILVSEPTDPSLPARRHLVRIAEVEATTDPLVDGPPVDITRLAWEEAQALPFELCLESTVVLGNVVPAVAGETHKELFVIGEATEELTAPLTRAVERQGPYNELTGSRSVTFLCSLIKAETEGLGWLGELREADPELELEELDPENSEPDPENPTSPPIPASYDPPIFWSWRRTLLDSLPDSRDFTLDDGTWRRIIGFRTPTGELEHIDYASGEGFTVRFGDGEFGKVPADGTPFRVRYRTGPGTLANLPRDAVTELSDDLAEHFDSATNPLPIASGLDPETLQEARFLAPEAFKAITYRAVREEDFREIIERLSWVQRAGAPARWTGSWLSTFVTADPLDAFELTDEQLTEIEDLTDGVRQVGREVIVQQPLHQSLDMTIHICLEPSAYASQVKTRVIDALTGQGINGQKPFFHPDNFTFGTPLWLASLEAAIQAVPGVKGVGKIKVHPLWKSDERDLTEAKFDVALNEVLRIENDPSYPERGMLTIEVVGEQDELNSAAEGEV